MASPAAPRKRFPRRHSPSVWAGFCLALALVFILPLQSLRGQTRPNPWSEQILQVERQWQSLYENYFGEAFPSQGLNGAEISRRLTELERQTGQRAAVVWLNPQPQALNTLMALPGRTPLGYVNSAIGAAELEQLLGAFLAEVAVPTLDRDYLQLSRRLYDLLLAPLESQLQANHIDILILCAGPGLRSLPFAALHNGRNFLIEDYALALIPGFNLARIGPGAVNGARVLALGASKFTDLPPLPGVALELAAIRQIPWPGETLLNQDFTPAALRQKRRQGDYAIVHLATHARFETGAAQSSYIQFADRKVRLTEIESLGLDSPPVELLALSACQTALGDRQVELGFSGLALRAGVRSVLASLWSVSDAGTLALMGEFYYRLKENSQKAEALRQSQIALIRGGVSLREGAIHNARQAIPLPFLPVAERDLNLSHPYYWSGFTLVGSPW